MYDVYAYVLYHVYMYFLGFFLHLYVLGSASFQEQKKMRCFHSHGGSPLSLDGFCERENPMKMDDDGGYPRVPLF